MECSCRSGLSLSAAPSWCHLSHPYSWIKKRVPGIYDEIRDNDKRRRQDGDPDDDGKVLSRDGEHSLATKAGKPKHDLCHDRAAEQSAEIDAELRDHGCDRTPKGMPGDDAPLGQSLGPSGSDVVFAEHVEHGATRES